ncbi:MAG: SDR family oxidoreductase [Cyanobacteria bacterium P01_E01_bin.42]
MNKPKRCFTCKISYTDSHSFYPGLCQSCGDINYRKRQQVADLQGKFALVTGARIKIGYGVVLKLLRDGATVIATTRFPHDAARRYREETDFEIWRDRLQIYKLDLRHLRRVEQFAEHLCDRYLRLDIIINNAAQTIRRPPQFYQHLQDFERLNFGELPLELQQVLQGDRNWNVEGSIPLQLASADPENISPNLSLIPSNSLTRETQFFPSGEYDEDGQQLDLRPFNSWLMKDDEVSLVEILEVQAINAIAPFLLNSRLKKLMQQNREESKYIINVSSMEGRFAGVNKPWRHPHTNMAKAALNQMTRTCASEYAKYKIYMNCVDPGWVSFQHPHLQIQKMKERGYFPPFDLMDAAARICDPIYQGINEGKKRFGKFYKNYLESDW